MIYYGMDALRILAAVVIVLVCASLLLDVATSILERKKAEKEKELAELMEERDGKT